jgi:hypothetical protein
MSHYAALAAALYLAVLTVAVVLVRVDTATHPQPEPTSIRHLTVTCGRVGTRVYRDPRFGPAATARAGGAPMPVGSEPVAARA